MSHGVNREGPEHHTRGASVIAPRGNTDGSGHDAGTAGEWLIRGARSGNHEGGNDSPARSVAESLNAGAAETETREQRGERLREERRARSGRAPARGRTTDANATESDSKRRARAVTTETAGRTEEETQPAKETVSRVGRPKIVPLFAKRGGKETLSDEFIAELWKGAFLLPSMWGWDNPDEPWWPLRDDEAENLAAPSARMLARMSPEQQELFSRFADPIILVMGLAGAMSWRLEMTRAYRQQLRIFREQEARRRGLSHSVKEGPSAVRGRVNGEGERRENVPTGTSRDVFSHGSPQDAFD